jgi:hypothetical protein
MQKPEMTKNNMTAAMPQKGAPKATLARWAVRESAREAGSGGKPAWEITTQKAAMNRRASRTGTCPRSEVVDEDEATGGMAGAAATRRLGP